MMTGSYERISQKLLQQPHPRPKPFCMFQDGHLHVGTLSLHRTAAARVWRLFWRLKLNRISRSTE